MQWPLGRKLGDRFAPAVDSGLRSQFFRDLPWLRLPILIDIFGVQMATTGQVTTMPTSSTVFALEDWQPEAGSPLSA